MKPEEVISDISADMSERLKSALEYLWKVQKYPLASYHLEDVTTEYKKFGWGGDLIFEIKTFNRLTTVGRFHLSFMPGCESNVLISHGVDVYEKFQKQGIGNALHRLKRQAASLIGITVMLATARVDNVAENKILKNNNWVEVLTFHNSYQNSDVTLVYNKL